MFETIVRKLRRFRMIVAGRRNINGIASEKTYRVNELAIVTLQNYLYFFQDEEKFIILKQERLYITYGFAIPLFLFSFFLCTMFVQFLIHNYIYNLF